MRGPKCSCGKCLYCHDRPNGCTYCQPSSIVREMEREQIAALREAADARERTRPTPLS